MAVPVQEVPLLVAGVLLVALAGVLLVLDFRGRLNRVFAVVLVIRGALNAASSLGRGDVISIWVHPWFEIAAPFALVWFLLAYRDTYGVRRASPWAYAALLVGALAAEGLYLLDHDLHGPSNVIVAYGPLAILGAAKMPLYAVGALVLANDHARLSAGPRRRSLALVAVAFALDAAFTAATAPFILLAQFVGLPVLPDPTLWVYLSVLTIATALPIALVAARRFAATAKGDPSAAADRQLFARGLAAAIATALLVVAARFAVAGSDLVLGPIFDGVWTLAFAVLPAYTLVRHQLFDIDLRIKWTIRSGTLAAIFVAVFFVVAQVAQEFLSENTGWAVGGVGAGLLLFALAPLHRLAERVADRAMPNVRALERLAPSEAAETYRELARIAWSDGAITSDERRMLDGARARLGLGVEQAVRIEGEAMPASGSS